MEFSSGYKVFADKKRILVHVYSMIRLIALMGRSLMTYQELGIIYMRRSPASQHGCRVCGTDSSTPLRGAEIPSPGSRIRKRKSVQSFLGMEAAARHATLSITFSQSHYMLCRSILWVLARPRRPRQQCWSLRSCLTCPSLPDEAVGTIRISF